MVVQFNGYRESLVNLFLIIRSVVRVLLSGKFILGDEVVKFENNISEYISNGEMYCVSVNSCTDAIYLSLKLKGIGKGDEVIVQSNTAIPTVNAIVMSGALPVFVDVDNTHQMDIDKVGELVTEKTSAIVLVHLFGYSTNVKKLYNFCKEKGIVLIEDCAQSFGGKYDGKKLGTFGDLSCFSFYPTKILGGYGDGGAIMCRTKEEMIRLKMMRFHGINDRGYYAEEFAFNTMNSRMDEIHASILNSKLKNIDKYINIRRSIGKFYNENITNESIIKVYNGESVYYNYPIRVNDRDKLIKYLKDNGVMVGVNYPYPIHEMVGYDGLCKCGDLKNTESFAKTIVNLPVYPTLRKSELNKIVKLLNNFK